MIEATPNPGYAFDRWLGAGITAYGAASTTVSMTEDREVSAVFIELNDLNDYNDWKPDALRRLANNETISAPLYDRDKDGLPNLLEYAFGTDPLFKEAGDVRPRVEFDSESADPIFCYRMRPGSMT